MTTPFTITPNGTPATGTGGPIFGLSQASAVTSYVANQVIIRQGDDGFWQYYCGNVGGTVTPSCNGGVAGYVDIPSATWVVSYPQTPATVVLTVDVLAETSSITLTQAGACATGCTLSNYPFRTAVTSLGYWNLDPTDGPGVTLSICNFGIATSGGSKIGSCVETLPSLADAVIGVRTAPGRQLFACKP
jgi:hypothetical protein